MPAEEVPELGVRRWEGGGGGGCSLTFGITAGLQQQTCGTHAFQCVKVKGPPRVIDGEAALLADVQHICKFRPGMTSHHGKIPCLSHPAQL